MIETPEPPRRLQRGDHRSEFTSGATELDEWFHRYSWQNQRAGNAVTYVSMLDGRPLGYYAIAAASVDREQTPHDFSRGRPQPIPCVLLARLAVDVHAQGQQLGASLFRDALVRSASVSQQLGAACLLIHCRDDNARAFYLHLVDAFASPVDPMHLVIPLAQVAQALV